MAFPPCVPTDIHTKSLQRHSHSGCPAMLLTMLPTLSGADIAASLALVLLGLLAIQAFWVAVKLHTIPGPPTFPLLGNLLSIVASGDFVQWRKRMAAEYGAVFQAWVGAKPMVIVTEPTAVKSMFLHEVDRPNMEEHVATVGEIYDVNQLNLLWLPGHSPQFRTVRRMFDLTLLSPSSLAAHASVLNEVTARLTRHVSSFAASGETFDASIQTADMAMEAIGFAAFGLDLDCLGEAASGIRLAVAAGRPAGWKAVSKVATEPARPEAEATSEKHIIKEVSPAQCTAYSAKAPTTGLQGTGHDVQDWLTAPPGSSEFSEGLVRTCRAFLMQTDVTTVSRWTQLNLLFPSFKRPLSYLAQLLPDARLKQNIQVRNDLMGIIRALICNWREHKQAGDASSAMAMSERGFLSQLLSHQTSGQDDALQDLDIISQCILMVLAGYETTSSALAMSLHLLSTHPDIQQRAQQEVDKVLQGKEAGPDDLERLPFIRAVFDETLRLYPPAEMVMVRKLAAAREVATASKMFRVPAGTDIMANAFTFQRDPACWPRPDEFLPQRHVQPGNEELAATVSAAYLPFGHGPRMCPGYKFAQLEGRLALAKLMQQYTFKPAPGCPPPKFKSGIVYIPDHVWLTAEARL